MAGLIVLRLAGCVVRTPADPLRGSADPPAPLAASDWLSSAYYPGAAKVTHVPGPCVFPDPENRPAILLNDEVLETVCRGRFGTGCVHEVRIPRRSPPRPGLMLDDVATMAFFSFRLVPLITDENEHVKGSFVSEDTTMLVGIQPPAATPVRGLVLHLTGLAGLNPKEYSLMRALRLRGWAVLSILSPSIRRWPTNAVGIDLDTGVEACATRFATELDDRIADRVYAIEVLMEYLRLERPDIPREPLVAIGCSAGALQLPALAARHPGAIDAAVLIAGGADFLDVVRYTGLSQRMLRDRVGFAVSWKHRAPTKQEWDAIQAAYLRRSRLDPIHTARFLLDTPVLMLHARHDAIVPARSGDRLYEQLGRPERWTYGLGHLGLFWWLPNEADRIADWIDNAVTGEQASVAATMPDSPERNASP